MQYLLGNVLHISALDEPEELLTMSPLTRGSLVHAILEDFMRAAQQQNALPGPGEEWNAAHRALLQDVARTKFAEFEALGLTGQQLLWQIEQARVRRELDEFLREDERLRAEYGVAPHAVEMKFGLPGAERPAVNWGDLAFHGAVDRVDIDPQGRFVLVLDYKTGLAGPYGVLNQDPLDRGRRLQLPIYGLAAREVFGPEVRIRAAYWFVTDRGGFVLRPAQPVELSAIEPGFATTVGAITDGIRGGLFPANPGEESQRSFENCAYCDFDSVCPARRDQIWQRKQGDPRLAGYAGLGGTP